MNQQLFVPARHQARCARARWPCCFVLLLGLATEASANSLLLVQPGQTNRSQMQALFGEPVRKLDSQEGTAEIYEATDRGYAQVAAWYGHSDTLGFVRVKMMADLSLEEASLLFLLSNRPTVEEGNPFAMKRSETGLMQHYDQEGVHFYVRDRIVRDIWITGTEMEATRLARASGVFDGSTDSTRPGIDPDAPRGWLGGAFGVLDQSVAADLDAPTEGVLVLGSGRHSPAHRAGLLPEDVLLELDGRAIRSVEGWSERLAAKRVGQDLAMTVWRNGRRRSLSTTLVAPPNPQQIPPLFEYGQVWLGVGLQSISSSLAETLTLPVHQGVLVRSLAPDGPAAAGGLREDDIIVTVNRQPVTETSEIFDTIESLQPGDELKLTVVRDRERLPLLVRLHRVPEAYGGRLAPVESLAGWGLSLRVLNSATAVQVRVPLRHGFFVEAVAPGGPADRARLQRGDVITHVQGRCVGSFRTLQRLSAGDRLRVVVLRWGRPFVTVIYD